MNSNNMYTEEYLMRFDYILNNMENKMYTNNLTDSITINFIICMIPHHEAAIEMCKNLLNYTNNTYLRRLANNIITTQTREISIMREIAQTTTYRKCDPWNIDRYQKDYLGIVNKMIYNMRHSLRSNNIDLDFTSEMIPHHVGAVEMCENLIQYPIDPRLKELAKTIITTQTRGIEELRMIQQNLLRR